jgi:hypothetical protein
VPEYRVLFERPVIYLVDHKRPNRRELTELLVNAPDAEAAKIHAVRVTLGDPGTIMVVPVSLWEIQNNILKVLRA